MTEQLDALTDAMEWRAKRIMAEAERDIDRWRPGARHPLFETVNDLQSAMYRDARDKMLLKEQALFAVVEHMPPDVQDAFRKMYRAPLKGLLSQAVWTMMAAEVVRLAMLNYPLGRNGEARKEK